MKKQKKLNLGTIKIESFVTSLQTHEKNKIKGGVSMGTICCPDEKTAGQGCPTNEGETCITSPCWCP